MNFLTENHVFFNEIIQKQNLSIGTLSNRLRYRQINLDDPENLELLGIRKHGKSYFVDVNFSRVSRVIFESRSISNKGLNFTNLKNSRPLPNLKAEFKVNPEYLKDFGEIFECAGVKFFRFNQDFVDAHRNKVWYSMNSREYNEFQRSTPDPKVKFMKVNKNNYICYY